MKIKRAAAAEPGAPGGGGAGVAPAGGWQPVAVGDELLIGALEGGFMELEELRPGAQQAGGPAAAAAPPDAAPPRGKRARAAQPPATDVGALQAELTRLRRENRKLRGTADPPLAAPGAGSGVGPGGPPDGAPAAGGAAPADAAAAHPAAPTAAGAGSAKKKTKRAKAREIRRHLLERKKAAKQRRRAAAPAAPAATAAAVAEPAAAAVPAAPAAAPAPAPSAWDEFGLDAQLLAGLAAQGFTEPTPIQRECLPAAVRDRRDVIGAAQTGSGKTLAFGLPILHALLAERAGVGGGGGGGRASDRRGRGGGPLRALVMAPTRELALQVCAHLDALGRPAGLWVVPIVGGLAPAKQARLLGRAPPVVVATPGRLWELMREGAPHLTDFTGLSFLVLDEADRMVQAGHFQARPRMDCRHS